MVGVARATVDYMSCSPANIISSGSPNVFVNGKPVARIGDPTPGHPGGSPSAMLTGNTSKVFANNIAVCVLGSKNTPHGSGPHGPTPPMVVTASSDVFIGN